MVVEFHHSRLENPTQKHSKVSKLDLFKCWRCCFFNHIYDLQSSFSSFKLPVDQRWMNYSSGTFQKYTTFETVFSGTSFSSATPLVLTHTAFYWPSCPSFTPPRSTTLLKWMNWIIRLQYLLPELHRSTVFPRRPHQRHLDPGPESSREGPRGTVLLTLTHKPCLVCTRETENTCKHFGQEVKHTYYYHSRPNSAVWNDLLFHKAWGDGADF